MNKLKALASQVLSDGQIEVVASTSNADRDQDVMVAEGWELENFTKNPVILWAHNPTLPPIGKAVKTWVEGGILKAKILFDMADPFAAMIYRKFKEGFLNAVSVGFIPKEQNERGEWIKQELLEISGVPIPANSEALRTHAFDEFQLAVKSFESKVKTEKEGYSGEQLNKKKDEDKDDRKKSPAYRLPNETVNQCVSRKVPELMEEGMTQEQAVGAAEGICRQTKEKKEDEKEHEKQPIKAEEATKNMLRIAIESNKQAVKALEEILSKTESQKGEDSTKIIIKAESAEDKAHRSQKIAYRALEIALSQYAKKK